MVRPLKSPSSSHPICFYRRDFTKFTPRDDAHRGGGRRSLPCSSRFPVPARFLHAHRDRNTVHGTLLPADMPIRKKIRQTTRNRKNKNLAIPPAAAAIPVNPRSAATSAIIRKINAQRSMLSPPKSNRIGESLRVCPTDAEVLFVRPNKSKYGTKCVVSA
jgi:hypothetical protein